MKYCSKRALGFCCSRQYAEGMAKEFCKRGISAVAVYSNADVAYSEDREIAIQKLKKQEIKVIFSVDMFNEGVDIAELDMVMFLRPTESPIVFLQQLRRGLLLCKGKEFYRVKELLDGKVASRMEFFTYMEDEIYQYCIRHTKENPFRKYMGLCQVIVGNFPFIFSQ